MKDVIQTIKKPMDAIENRFRGSWVRALVILSIVLGIFAVTNILGTLFYCLMKYHGHAEMINWLNLVLKESILKPLILCGSMFAGLYIYSTIRKKDFSLVDILTTILVTFLFYYLIHSALNILYCFPFMTDVKFLGKIYEIISHMADWYIVVVFVFALHKLYGFELTNKCLGAFIVLLAVMFCINDFLSLAL